MSGPAEGGQRQLPTDHKGLSRAFGMYSAHAQWYPPNRSASKVFKKMVTANPFSSRSGVQTQSIHPVPPEHRRSRVPQIVRGNSAWSVNVNRETPLLSPSGLAQ